MLSNTIGNNIKRLRIKYRMNQELLAERLNIRRQTISSYERGNSVPDIYTLIRIADIFNVTLDELAGRELNGESCKKKKL